MKMRRLFQRTRRQKHSVNLAKFRNSVFVFLNGITEFDQINGIGKRRILLLGVWFAALAFAGCDKPAAETKPGPLPVVRQAPVETHPFEDGYDAGYAMALGKAARDSKIPKPSDVEPLAREQAGAAPERTERWQRGFVEGYVDGFRKVVTGQK